MLRRHKLYLEKNTLLQYIIAALILAVYIRSMFIPLWDKDAAHHANIALNMIQRNDYFSLIDRGKDYLDKPHLLFWLAVGSFKLFGISSFTYRLPSLLFSLLSIFSVYKLTLHLSDKTTAKIAALLIATSQAFILAVMEARMEAPLTGSIALGLWQLVMYIDKRKLRNLLWATLALAMAFSTKGWIGPVMIVVPCFMKIWLEKKWSVLFQLRTYAAFPLFALLISPVLYAYYYQFDLHPEKVIRNMTHISGVKFILWNQNFERFDGDNWGGRNSSYWFFYHTFLWAFLPWCVAAYMGLFYWLRRMFWKKKRSNPFNFAAIGFAFILFVISFSDFKMPHYIVMLFPLAAVFTAPYLRLSLSTKAGLKLYYTLHVVIVICIVILTLALNFYFFPPESVMVAVVGILLLAGMLFILFKRTQQRSTKTLLLATMAVLVFNFFLNYNFFPQLLQYQAGNELVKKMQDEHISIADKNIIMMDTESHAFDFYRKYNHVIVEADSLPQHYNEVSDKYFLMTTGMQRQLQNEGYKVKPVVEAINYRVTKLKLKFLDRTSRAGQCDSLMLARINK